MLLALAVSAALAAAPISVRSLAAVVVARTPMWIRHYNASVAPARCGDINIEPLFPIGISDETIQRYASNSIEDYSAYVLELGECGKSYTGYEPENHSWPVINMTKRNNPPSLGAPWFTRGKEPGGGIPGLPGTSSTFHNLCVEECVCSSTNQTIHSPVCPTVGCPPCTDANCKGRCELCSPSFNKKLEGTMINLWCDPSDPDCKNGRPSRPVPPPSPTPSTPQGKPPPPMAAGCVSADADGPVSFKWTGGFVFPKLPDHGFVTANSSASCCAMCQTFKNCTFWTYEYGGTVAKQTCYDKAGGCCYLRTAAAWAVRTAAVAPVVSGSTEPLPVAPPPPPGVKVVACVGDSITAGYLSSNNMDYPHQLQTMLGSKFIVKNFGAGGRTMLKKGDQPYWTTGPLRFALESKPDIVVLMLGTNDAKVNNWKPLHAEFPVDYKAMIDTFKNLTKVPKIYLMVPPPLYQDGAYGMNQTVINTLFPGDGAAGINMLAKASGLDAPIDLFTLWEGHCPVLGGTPGHPPSKTHVMCDWIAKGDACHPSNKGYGKLAAAVAAKIK